MPPYDTVYYWEPTLREWVTADLGDLTPVQKRRELTDLGYVAHTGRKSIGPPEGPPE